VNPIPEITNFQNVEHLAVSREKPYRSLDKAIPVPTPFRFKPGRGSPHFPKNENRKREAKGLQSCNPGRKDYHFI